MLEGMQQFMAGIYGFAIFIFGVICIKYLNSTDLKKRSERTKNIVNLTLSGILILSVFLFVHHAGYNDELFRNAIASIQKNEAIAKNDIQLCNNIQEPFYGYIPYVLEKRYECFKYFFDNDANYSILNESFCVHMPQDRAKDYCYTKLFEIRDRENTLTIELCDLIYKEQYVSYNKCLESYQKQGHDIGFFASCRTGDDCIKAEPFTRIDLIMICDHSSKCIPWERLCPQEWYYLNTCNCSETNCTDCGQEQQCINIGRGYATPRDYSKEDINWIKNNCKIRHPQNISISKC